MDETAMSFVVNENFPVSGIEDNRVKVSNEPMLEMEDSSTINSNISHFNETEECERMELDVIASESNSDTINSDTVEFSEIAPENAEVAEGDNACAEYKTVAVNIENMTKTTVINTSFNVISQSTVKDIKRKFIFNSTGAQPVLVQDPFDKSRVVVQVLTSNTQKAKLQTVIKSEKRPKPPNSVSFRADVSRMLTKEYYPSESEDSESNIVSMNEQKNVAFDVQTPVEKDCTGIKQGAKEVEFNTGSTNSARKKRRNLKYFFMNGRGLKFSEIEYVASNLKNAQPRLLRIVHYLLFDSYGACSTSLKLSKTMRNILHFCGYPFDRDSEEFQKKIACLSRLPLPMLYQIYKTIIGNDCDKRSDMVVELIEFLLEPQDFKAGSHNHKKNQKHFSEEEYAHLRNIAISRPLPTVVVKKLDECEIEQLQNQIKLEYKEDKPDLKSDYEPPMYILNGPGKKLKSFPQIVSYVETASRRLVELLHCVLYGRMEPEEICRKNILEFSGYLPCQKDFINQARSMLRKLVPIELFQLCKILGLHTMLNTARCRKIDKIMNYLAAPGEPSRRKVRTRKFLPGMGYSFVSRIERTKQHGYGKPEFRSYKRLKKNGYRKSGVRSYRRPKENGYGETEAGSYEKPKENGYEKSEVKSFETAKEIDQCIMKDVDFSKCNTEMEEVDSGPKLRDFDKICFNIECAAPSDLLELNDLLFIKPSDELEIHQRILDFTKFKFSTNSIEYHYRKTLMHYMGFCILRKIAQLLAIENWEKSSSQEDLSSNILNFLMEMKPVSHLSNKTKSPRSAIDTNFSKKTDLIRENKRKAEESVDSLKENKKTVFLKKNIESQKENKKSECQQQTLESHKENDVAKFQKETMESEKENAQVEQSQYGTAQVQESQNENEKVEEAQNKNAEVDVQNENTTVQKSQKENTEVEECQKEYNKVKECLKEYDEVGDCQKENDMVGDCQKENNITSDSQTETITSKCFQLKKKEIKKRFSFLNSISPTGNISSPVLPRSPETLHKNSNNTNHQILRRCKKQVFIHKLTKASENTPENKHDSVVNGWSAPDDSTPLCALIHHPSDEELKQLIHEIIEKDLFLITVGDLVKKVYCCYPKINLQYREDFIKAEAIQILAQMRSNAVDTLNRILVLPNS